MAAGTERAVCDALTIQFTDGGRIAKLRGGAIRSASGAAGLLRGLYGFSVFCIGVSQPHSVELFARDGNCARRVSVNRVGIPPAVIIMVVLAIVCQDYTRFE